MPCDQVQTTRCTLDAADIGLLADALRDLGYDVRMVGEHRLIASHDEYGSLSYDSRTKTLEQTGDAQDENAIKVAYSTAVVRKVASRFGWKVQQQQAKGNVAVKLTASKRSF